MARERNSADFVGPLRRLLVGLLLIACAASFLAWRIDNPRMERVRAAVLDRVLPPVDWLMAPIAGLAAFVSDFQSYRQLYAQNQDLRRELQQMRAWREAAIQLEQENARLLDLNNVRLDPNLTFITGVVMTDSGSPFRQSVLINIGHRDGVQDGWPAMDGIGLVGRISGTGQRTSRVLLLTDASSRVPVLIQPSGQRAILTGDNGLYPVLDFLESPESVRPGDRVVTSGDGALLPPGLLVGQVALGSDGRQRVLLAADYRRLEFLRVLRAPGIEAIEDPGSLILPVAVPGEAAQTGAEAGAGAEIAADIGAEAGVEAGAGAPDLAAGGSDG